MCRHRGYVVDINNEETRRLSLLFIHKPLDNLNRANNNKQWAYGVWGVCGAATSIPTVLFLCAAIV